MGKFSVLSKKGREEISCTLSVFPLDRCQQFSVRGTPGGLRHPRRSRYRCSLPGLAGFAGPRCTEPEVPRSGTRVHSRECSEKSSTASPAQPERAAASAFSISLVLILFFRSRISRADQDFGFAAAAAG